MHRRYIVLIMRGFVIQKGDLTLVTSLELFALREWCHFMVAVDSGWQAFWALSIVWVLSDIEIGAFPAHMSLILVSFYTKTFFKT